VRARATRSRELIAKGRRPAVVARVLQVNRTGLYRAPSRRPRGQRRPLVDRVDQLIVDVARANPTDGTRMVAALVSQQLGWQVNRKRAQRVMREQRLLQRHRPLRRRRRPGFFRVERPDQLWHLDMTAVWVAEHGWCYLNAAIDCCTREIVGWSLELRCRTDEAITLVDHAVAARTIEPGWLTLGTDNGSAFTSRAFRARLGELGVTHRRGGYRDPESQAFIESWFGKLKERLVRDPRPGEKGDRRLHPDLPAPTAQRPPLPDTGRGATDLGGWTATSQNSGLKCRPRRGPGHTPSRSPNITTAARLRDGLTVREAGPARVLSHCGHAFGGVEGVTRDAGCGGQSSAYPSASS
jgi:putative transposase